MLLKIYRGWVNSFGFMFWGMFTSIQFSWLTVVLLAKVYQNHFKSNMFLLYWLEGYKMTSIHTTLSRAFPWYKNNRRDSQFEKVWTQSQTNNQISMYIYIYRYCVHKIIVSKF